MKSILQISDNYNLIITIIVVLFVYGCIYANILGVNFKEYIDNNWVSLKNNIFILPFSGFLGKGKGKNIFSKTIYNIYSFFHSIFKNFISFFIKPFVFFFEIVSKLLKNITNTLLKFRIMAQVFRNLFQRTVEKTADTLSNSYAAIIYLQEKLKVIIKKQSALFALFNEYNKSMNFILYSFIKGPIPKFAAWMPKYATMMMAFLGACVACIVGGPFTKIVTCPVCAVCFDEDTLIDMEDNSNKRKIKDIFIGYNIKEGGKIKGIINIQSKNIDMYSYNNVLVSGSHLVYENSIWKRVENSDIGKKILYNDNKNLICLITENNKIYSNNIIFSDYQETNDISIRYDISNMILNYLNYKNLSNKANYLPDMGEINNYSYNLGFSKNTIIQINKNKFKYIQDIDIGDNISDNVVLGRVILDSKNIKFYNYKGIISSGTQLVYENDIWIEVYKSKYSYEVNFNDIYIYHIITDKNIININGILFRDFCETHDKTINNNIDKIVESHLNS